MHKIAYIELILLVAISFAIMVFVGAIGSVRPALDLDPRWVGNGLLAAITSLCAWFAVEQWKMRKLWEQIWQSITQDESPYYGTAGRFFEIVRQEAELVKGEFASTRERK